MKNIGIQQPCSEDWNQMTPSEKGAFCQKCAKHVHDFTNKSGLEIKRTLLELRGQEICGRMTREQEMTLNLEFEAWIKANQRNFQHVFITALLIVFGLALFSCEDERDRRMLADTQTALSRVTELKEPETTVGMMLIPTHIEEAPYEMYGEPIPEIVTVIDVDSTIHAMEEVEIIHDHEYYVTSGIMVSTTHYGSYLEETVAPVETDENGVPYPTEFKAFAFPNPAVESTTIEIQAPKKEQAEMHLYDLSGKLIRTIYAGELPRGVFRRQIDLNDLNPGMYLVIIRSADLKETVRIVKQ